MAICGGRDSKAPTYQTVTILSKCTKVSFTYSPGLRILRVRHWRFMFSINLFIKFVLFLSPALEREGRKGSLAKFGCGVGFERFANVPCSEGMVWLTRPKISLHFLIHNPVSNLHFNFNPKYCLQFLNPSLWSGA